MTEIIEKSILVCKCCGVTKIRILDGRFPNKKDQRWIDPDTKRQWSGKVCSECHRENCAKRKRANSKIKEALRG